MSLDISVSFDELKRGGNGEVIGKVALHVKIEALGKSVDIPVDARNFNFPREGEQTNLYDQNFPKDGDVAGFKAKVTASVYEKPAGQCCIKGHVHVDGPIGGGIGKDLDPNCKAIPGG